MTEYRDIIRRLRAGQSSRLLQRETGPHRTIIRKMRKKALKRGWLEKEYSYVVMHRLIVREYACSEATVRRYMNGHLRNRREAGLEESACFALGADKLEIYRCFQNFLRFDIFSAFVNALRQGTCNRVLKKLSCNGHAAAHPKGTFGNLQHRRSLATFVLGPAHQIQDFFNKPRVISLGHQFIL